MVSGKKPKTKTLPTESLNIDNDKDASDSKPLSADVEISLQPAVTAEKMEKNDTGTGASSLDAKDGSSASEVQKQDSAVPATLFALSKTGQGTGPSENVTDAETKDSSEARPPTQQPAAQDDATEEAKPAPANNLSETSSNNQNQANASTSGSRGWSLYGSWGSKNGSRTSVNLPSSSKSSASKPPEPQKQPSQPESVSKSTVAESPKLIDGPRSTDEASVKASDPISGSKSTSKPNEKNKPSRAKSSSKQNIASSNAPSISETTTAPESSTEGSSADAQPSPGQSRSTWYGAGWWPLSTDKQPAETSKPKTADDISSSKQTAMDQAPQEDKKTTTRAGETSGASTVLPAPAGSSSWFGYLSFGNSSDSARPSSASQSTAEMNQSTESDPLLKKPKEISEPVQVASEPKSSSAWGLWTRKSPASDTQQANKIDSELAVSGTKSESKPVPLKTTKRKHSKDSVKVELPDSPRSAGAVAEQKVDIPKKAAKTAKSLKSDEPVSPSTTRNVVIPSLEAVFQPEQPPTYWQSMRRFLLGGSRDNSHVSTLRNVPKIKKAVAIGVHGWFPDPRINNIIGQPTGKSGLFAKQGARAVERWVKARGYTCELEEIVLEGDGLIETRVENLWDLLSNWKSHIQEADFIVVASHSQGVPVSIILISKMLEQGYLRPDAKIGVCAMAGVSMGPFPFSKIGSWFLGPSALQLFEFSNADSDVSNAYFQALDAVLQAGVKITYVGSLDDQVVPLNSSTFLGVSHPHIFRAVFVDGHRPNEPAVKYHPDFLTKLIGLTYKVINWGIPDHGFIKELAPALAGSFYNGNGHSRLYFDPQVYDLAIKFALETTTVTSRQVVDRVRAKGVSGGSDARDSTDGSVKSVDTTPAITATTTTTPAASKSTTSFLSSVLSRPECRPTCPAPIQHKSMYPVTGDPTSPTVSNPYFLPWALRGLLEEEVVRKQLEPEVKELSELFKGWAPSSKALKEVQYRLDAIKSKL